MKLYELLDKALLARMVNDGYVREQVHPSEPLCILNYTEKAAYEAVWNEVTLACRGLIYNMVDETIVARPFPKFFNYEQLSDKHGLLNMRSPVEVTDKMDGSLGILYHEPISGLWSIATRGSFASDQAVHATEVLREKYCDWCPVDLNTTYLFEIVYPQNRIVLNYGGTDNIFLLGSVEIATGRVHGPIETEYNSRWPGFRTKVFSACRLEEALEIEPRENAEGIVVRYLDTGLMIKIKQADYVALHKLVTGMNDRVIWERLAAEEDIDSIKAGLPDEFWPWIDRVADDLFQRADQIIMSVWEDYLAHTACLPEGFTRKDFALAVKDSPNKAWLFNYLDGKPIWGPVWKTLKPAAVKSMVEDDEEE